MVTISDVLLNAHLGNIPIQARITDTLLDAAIRDSFLAKAGQLAQWARVSKLSSFSAKGKSGEK